MVGLVPTAANLSAVVANMPGYGHEQSHLDYDASEAAEHVL